MSTQLTKAVLQHQLQQKADKKSVGNVPYRHWITADWCNLETVTNETDEYVEYFCYQLLSLKKHSFIIQ
jgi:hypothetical protein